MSLRLNFCRSVPPEFLRLIFRMIIAPFSLFACLVCPSQVWEEIWSLHRSSRRIRPTILLFFHHQHGLTLSTSLFISGQQQEQKVTEEFIQISYSGDRGNRGKELKSRNWSFDNKNQSCRTQKAIWARQDLLVKAIPISQVVTYFERGRKDSRREVFLIGGGVASTSTSGGELTWNMYHQ